MNIKEALIWARKKLKSKKIDSAALDTEILLAFVIKKPKEYLFAYPEKKLKNSQIKTYKLIISRRARHEPVAYITGHKEFFGLDFIVNKNVLIPRPETELLVEETLNFYKQLATNNQQQMTFIDIGTGSGVIITSIANNLKNYEPNKLQPNFIAIDTSPEALKIAKLNAKRNNVKIKLIKGNLLNPNQKIRNSKFVIRNSIILANLPYLTTEEWRASQPEIKKYEPRLAFDGGPDGLKYYRELFEQLKNLLQPGQNSRESAMDKNPRVSVFLEISYKQAKAIKKLAKQYLPEYEVEIKKDLAGFDRIAIIK